MLKRKERKERRKERRKEGKKDGVLRVDLVWKMGVVLGFV